MHGKISKTIQLVQDGQNSFGIFQKVTKDAKTEGRKDAKTQGKDAKTQRRKDAKQVQGREESTQRFQFIWEIYGQPKLKFTTHEMEILPLEKEHQCQQNAAPAYKLKERSTSLIDETNEKNLKIVLN